MLQVVIEGILTAVKAVPDMVPGDRLDDRVLDTGS